MSHGAKPSSEIRFEGERATSVPADMPVEARRNAFEALCALASEENWCWRIGCTTCVCSHFRHAFRALVEGGHPDADTWEVHAHRRLKTKPDLSWHIVLEERHALIAILSSASIPAISRQCRFPDWLGYMGLGLFACREEEREDRRLAGAWCPQLRSLIQSGSVAATRLDRIVSDHTTRFTLSDLELVERAFVRRSPLESH